MGTLKNQAFLGVLFVILGIGWLSEPSLGAGRVPPDSAVRRENEDFRQSLRRYLRQRPVRPRPKEGKSAHHSAKPISEIDFSQLAPWQDREIQDAFLYVRNLKFIRDTEHPGMIRRSSWLYPHDGCFARAALAVDNLEKFGTLRPAKLFAFGNLRVKTPNSDEGQVSWWYHVVPVVKNARGEPMVLDPAIEPKQPLPVKEWFNRMSVSPTTTWASLCDSYTYAPDRPCHYDTPPTPNDQALMDQKYYLSAEWENLELLKRSPRDELGDRPPWGQSQRPRRMH